MQKRTHLIFAFLLFSVLNFIFHFPLYLSVFAFIGAMIPDIDLYPRKFHRKICHNLFFLAVALFIGFKYFGFGNIVAIVFGIGYISHILLDGITIQGIYPFWPYNKIKIKGPIRTGKFSEYIVMLILLVIILSIYGIVKISI